MFVALNFKTLNRTVDALVQTLLTPIESLLLNSISLPEEISTRPVFVIGPPRSGTTLLYQLLVNRFDFIYLDNLSSKFYSAPTVGMWLSKTVAGLAPRTSTGYESAYGKTESIFGPNEAG